MRFTKRSLTWLLVITAPAAWANEHGAAPAGEHGGGGGEGAAPPREQKEFTDKTVKANALLSKIEESRKHFEELVKEKEEAKTAAAKVPVLKEMVELAKQRDKDQAEYEKLRSELAQRYPNGGAHVNRHKPAEHGAEHGGGEHGGGEHGGGEHEAAHGGEHEPKAEAAHGEGHGGGHHAETNHPKPPVAETAPTFDGLLDETKQLIDRKYAPFNPKKDHASPRAPASLGDKARPARLRLEQ